MLTGLAGVLQPNLQAMTWAGPLAPPAVSSGVELLRAALGLSPSEVFGACVGGVGCLSETLASLPALLDSGDDWLDPIQ